MIIKRLQRLGIIFLITFLFTGTLAYPDDLENKMGKVIKKYTSSEAPFDLTGRWYILIPKVADAFQQNNPPKDYSSKFTIILIELKKDGTALMKLYGKSNWEKYRWEHAWSGPHFYILFSGEQALKIMYYVSQEYQEKEPFEDIWLSIKDAWEVGVIQYQLSMLGYQMLMGKENDEIKKKVDELKKQEKPPNIITFPVVIANMINGKEQSGGIALFTRHDVTNK